MGIEGPTQSLDECRSVLNAGVRSPASDGAGQVGGVAGRYDATCNETRACASMQPELALPHSGVGRFRKQAADCMLDAASFERVDRLVQYRMKCRRARPAFETLLPGRRSPF